MPRTKFSQSDNAFRDLLKELRLVKGLTQGDIARRLGVPQSYVSKYETGERRLDFVETTYVCEALEIDMPKFLAAFSRKVGKSKK